MSKLAEEIKESFKRGSLLTKLIYINAGLFIPFWFIDLFSQSFIGNWIAVQPTFGELLFRPWTPITYMFTHTAFFHLLFNMLWLFWFGQLFMRFLRGKQLFAVYILGGLFGALFHVLSNEFLPVKAPAIGASASVMAVVLAVASYRPDYTINLIFIGQVKLKYLAIIAVVLDIMGVAANMSAGKMDGVAHMAHLGGALYGLWFGFAMRKNKDITRKFNNFMDEAVAMFSSSSSDRNRRKMKSNSSKFGFKQKPGRDIYAEDPDIDFNRRKNEDENELNRILDKINKSGYESLSKKEKEFLFKQRK